MAAWQVSLGFSLGLLLLYLLALLTAVVAIWWLRAGRPQPPRRLVWATVAGALLLTVVSFALARPAFQRFALAQVEQREQFFVGECDQRFAQQFVRRSRQVLESSSSRQ